MTTLATHRTSFYQREKLRKKEVRRNREQMQGFTGEPFVHVPYASPTDMYLGFIDRKHEHYDENRLIQNRAHKWTPTTMLAQMTDWAMSGRPNCTMGGCFEFVWRDWDGENASLTGSIVPDEVIERKPGLFVSSRVDDIWEYIAHLFEWDDMHTSQAILRSVQEYLNLYAEAEVKEPFHKWAVNMLVGIARFQKVTIPGNLVTAYNNYNKNAPQLAYVR